MSQPIRLLVADDHPVVRDGLVAMLGTQPDFAVVGQASNGVQVVQMCQSLHPDLVLLDLEMPELDGVEAIRQLNDTQPGIKVLVFTAFDTDERIVGSIQAGAKGYMLKGAPRSELFNAIRVISQGGTLFQPVIASRLLMRVQDSNAATGEALTDRERQVLELLAQGKSNKEIASTLVITERTAKFHVSSIMNKLRASNRTEAVTIGVRRGLIDIK